jgi:hypothetical protein
MATLDIGKLRLGHDATPNAPAQSGDCRQWLGLEENLPFVDDGHAAAQLRDVVDDVCRQDHDGLLTDLAEEIEEAHALGGIEARGGLVDDDE